MADAMPETQQQMLELHPVFSRMVQCLMADDTDGLMELYHPEVEWTRFQKVVRGRGAVLGQRELLGLLLPTLRADFELVESYRPVGAVPLAVPRRPGRPNGRRRIDVCNCERSWHQKRPASH
jgi:hypothetical protein